MVRISPPGSTGGDGSGGSGSSLVPSIPDSLQDNMDPRQRGILGAFFAIIISGVGAILVAPFIGITAIPTGITIAVQILIGGLQTFLVSFIDAFFAPFLTGATCATGGSCEATIKGVESANAFVATAGAFGFVVAVITAGAAAWGVAMGVSWIVE